MKIAMFIVGLIMILGFQVKLPVDHDLRTRQAITLIAYLLVAASLMLLPTLLNDD